MGFSALAAATVVGGVASAAIGSSASRSAANTQAQSAQQATNAQLQMFEQNRDTLRPFVDMGLVSGNRLMSAMGLVPGGTNELNAPVPTFNPMQYETFNPTMAQLEATPGYQFALDQGLKGVTNQFSAQGLIGSGAQGKGLAQYAQGLASQTFNQQLQNHLAQQQAAIQANQTNFQTGFNADQINRTNMFNRLSAVTGTGQSAAAGTATMGTQVAANVGQNMVGAGNAMAAGAIGSANAIAGGINNAVGGVTNAWLMNRLLAGSGPQPATAST